MGGGKDWEVGPGFSNAPRLLKPNREVFNTNKAHRGCSSTPPSPPLPLGGTPPPSFASSQVDYCTSHRGTSHQSTPWPLPMVRFPWPRAESLLLWLFKKCSASDITPLHHRSRLVKTAWITPNLTEQAGDLVKAHLKS